MKVSKDLALALDFENAPADVKQAAKQLREQIQKSHKADTQFNLWRIEKQKANADATAAYETFTKLLESWSPEETPEPVQPTGAKK